MDKQNKPSQWYMDRGGNPDAVLQSYWVMDETGKDVIGSPEYSKEEFNRKRDEIEATMQFVVSAWNTAIKLNPDDPKAVMDWIPQCVDAMGRLLNAEAKDFERLYLEIHTLVKKMNPSFKEKNPLMHLLMKINQ